jgi:hypothetical protein
MRKMHGGFSSAGLREAFFVSFTAIFLGLASVFLVLEVLEVSTIFLIPRLSVGLRV